jgi:hypothetical protein
MISMKILGNILLSAAVAWVVCVITPCKTSSFTAGALEELDKQDDEQEKRIDQMERRLESLRNSVEALITATRKPEQGR